MNFNIYWFMFPVSISFVTTAMLSGIGGAAIFMPILFDHFSVVGAKIPLG